MTDNGERRDSEHLSYNETISFSLRKPIESSSAAEKTVPYKPFFKRMKKL
jgi:hypothetical protein